MKTKALEKMKIDFLAEVHDIPQSYFTHLINQLPMSRSDVN